MLAGFHAMDEHFRTAPFERNLPVLLGLIGIWYDDFFGAETAGDPAVQPVPRPLPRVPAAARHGERRQVASTSRATRSTCQTGPIVWGQPGTNGQHAYYQLIHQGTKLIPCDFIGFVHANHEVGDHQDLLMANFFAQTEALAFGKTTERGRGRRRARVPGAAPHVRGQPPDEHDPGRAPDPVRPRPARRDVRAQGVHAGHRLGHQLASTSGAWSSARCWPTASSPSSTRPTNRPSPTTRHQRADRAVPAAAVVAARLHRRIDGAAATTNQRSPMSSSCA